MSTSNSDIIIKGAREHNLRDVNLVLPRNQLICLTGVSGSGKSSLAFRHALCRRPAPLCREPQFLRAAVSRSDAQARCRFHRWLEPVDFDFAKVGRHQSPFDGRHDHRNLRLPARALRSGRHGPLPGLRPADHGSVARGNHRADPGDAQADEADCHGAPDSRSKGEYKDLFDDLANKGSLEPAWTAKSSRCPRTSSSIAKCDITSRSSSIASPSALASGHDWPSRLILR